MEKMEELLRKIIATHPNPNPIIQDLYNHADFWQKGKIKDTALRLGIKLVDKEA